MLKRSLLIIGLLMLINQTYFYPLSLQVQTYIFLAGVVICGIPHGAADLLISVKEANDRKVPFSHLNFFSKYLGRLLAFLALLLLLPFVGLIVFIIIGSFHFGETDLNRLDTDSIKGSFLSFSYGLVVISVIVLGHFQEVKTLLLLFQSGQNHAHLINWVDRYKVVMLSISLILFFSTVFIYFLGNTENPESSGEFLVDFSVLVFITFNLPMILGLTFYFIFWHSILSIKNIVAYFNKDNYFPFMVIIRQICFYSFLAIIGILLFGITGFMFLNSSTMVIYMILGLAVLTAPHINIMHIMYKGIRIRGEQF
ncbi:Brp/Blh family beta-carotene 15,15'-dioxygenase [Mucilaginibacter flavidus]|uniref:Brp/Blh family beta-carotene 15,15'-dioxygenase n=1 Tax=Mucilaginibacter flavidus TaxID=2949309 RepID=UPI00209353B1|nr:Brp/Blh family beta-carotene 15,15'-dioxygenase [Mucilaginibacter flavidus]MCO5949328.1 Brp/Blh family beta-carotene 15,15'-dioxygenase [Mucilaginibacter flavidus]